MRKRSQVCRRKPHESGALKHVVAADAGIASSLAGTSSAGVLKVGDSAAQLNSVLGLSKGSPKSLKVPIRGC